MEGEEGDKGFPATTRLNSWWPSGGLGMDGDFMGLGEGGMIVKIN